ncbi:hypothetical protein SCOCK_340044 [Actinacidiphila cocklensis]|uniref:Uncharacterized protein n=1 Tax=Actinacidiphila cocklensis TaxID=887465 RepID=A0A9W4DQ68_9ACTN|nr:hypothetical protein SCOCK_340044 [Actinacidiphila cocklensis]
MIAHSAPHGFAWGHPQRHLDAVAVRFHVTVVSRSLAQGGHTRGAGNCALSPPPAGGPYRTDEPLWAGGDVRPVVEVPPAPP